MRAQVLPFPRIENRCRLRSSDLPPSVTVHTLNTLGVSLICGGTGSTDRLSLDEEALLLSLAKLTLGKLEAGEVVDDNDEKDNDGVLELTDSLLSLEPAEGASLILKDDRALEMRLWSRADIGRMT